MIAKPFEYVAICENDKCPVKITNADERKARSLGSHHAWAHHHSVLIFRQDLTLIAQLDHEGISTQPSLF